MAAQSSPHAPREVLSRRSRVRDFCRVPQGLENRGGIFPSLGKNNQPFSKPWKFPAVFFQGMEKSGRIFPRLGKHAPQHV
jgi:hypothetical protein